MEISTWITKHYTVLLLACTVIIPWLVRRIKACFITHMYVISTFLGKALNLVAIMCRVHVHHYNLNTSRNFFPFGTLQISIYDDSVFFRMGVFHGWMFGRSCNNPLRIKLWSPHDYYDFLVTYISQPALCRLMRNKNKHNFWCS